MSANRIDTVIDNEWYVKISDLNKQLALVYLTRIYCNLVGKTQNIKTKCFLSVDINLKDFFKHALCQNLSVLFYKNMNFFFIVILNLAGRTLLSWSYSSAGLISKNGRGQSF